MPEVPPHKPSRGRLFRQYALLINALVGTLLLASAVLSLTFSYRESRDHLVALQFEQAQGAAARIEQYIAGIEQQIGWTALSGMNAGADPLEARRIDSLKLLRQVPAITEVAWLDAQGREQLRVSRLALDTQDQGLDRSAEPLFTEPAAGRVWRGPVSFRKQTEPYMTIARRAGPGRSGGVTVVEVNLKFVWDVVARIRPGHPDGGGLAYAVDQSGALIAHPDISLVLKQTNLRALPQVAASLAADAIDRPPGPAHVADAAGGVAVEDAQDLAGQPVLSAYARLEPLGWRVFVESPRSQTLAPVYASLQRLGLLLAAGLVISMMASAWLARTLVRPIRQLQDGAARLAAGDLDHRLTVATHDELEDLAGEFNRMAGELKGSYEGLERKVREHTAELAEALARQTATAEVLQVIGRSVADAGPVFAKILESCEQLIPDTVASLLDLVDGDRIVLADFRMRVTDNATAEVRAARDRRVRAGYPHPLRGSATEAALDAGRVVEFSDTLNGPDTPPQTREFALSAGYPFSLMVAPMRWEGRPIGSIGVVRYTLVPFRPKERELLQTFADQAAIAIQNARLFTETREALEQRTATTEVLQAISRSVADPQPVFEKILDHCERLFGSDQPGIFLVDDEGQLRVGAFRGPDRARVLASYPKPLGDTLSAVAIRAHRPVELADVLADPAAPAYLRTLAEQTGNFAVMVAPLIHAERAIGSIVVTRR
ncbi:putative sensor with HAMP domain [Leptothrix cholodnii SP-6]|uniref:Putative sensor with HAMP domain n=1 Tax=Leptothrix cholodnii (strain ATCC 51168 / LMG 8142 / SP-6) TaxID=395495 RepID=B1Y5Y3_LEPCP|nr:GAF domain-containing protein [Leptothrix cholodnii]ACB32330.1 putative sensor with HAMP domain [Leptothrix cholodnii SP-6]